MAKLMVAAFILAVSVSMAMAPEKQKGGSLKHWVSPVHPVQTIPYPRMPEWQVINPLLLLPETVTLEQVFAECRDNRDPCIVKNSPGGNLYHFQSVARQVNAGARNLIVIDGWCISACAVFADQTRAKVCITPSARFGFHKARGFRSVKVAGETVGWEFDHYFDPPHAPDIAGWVRERKGFPEQGLLVMSYTEASAFWRTCKSAIPLPRPRPKVTVTRR